MKTHKLTINNIDFSDYDKAQKYYSDLKNKMLDAIYSNKRVHTEIKQLEKEVKDEVENAIVQDIVRWQGTDGAYDAASTMLTKIEESVVDYLDGSNKGFQNLILDLEKQAQQTSKDTAIQEAELKKLLHKRQEAIFKEINFDKASFENMLRGVGQTGNADFSDIVAHGTRYFIRLLYDKVATSLKLDTNKFVRLLTIGGFYKEAAEYALLEKYFSKHAKNLKVYHAGSQQTELDVIISELDDLDTILTGNETITIAIEENELTDSLTQDLLKQIQWYGEQVKSWRLSSGANTYSIGSRAGLYNAFINQDKSNAYNILAAMQFLAQYKNILLSLGPTNALFASGDKRQWMCDFIKEFRTKHYALTFAPDKDNNMLSSHVILERYMTARNQMRKKFLAI